MGMLPSDSSGSILTRAWAPTSTKQAIGGRTRPVRSKPSAELAAAPAQVGRYEVKDVLGHGSFGAVYLAYDPQLRRTVALKTPRWVGATGSSADEGFLHEARVAAQLKHPHVVTIYDVGTLPDGGTFIAMEHVDGETLRDRLSAAPMSVAESLRILAQVADAVAQAHAQQIVHRDLKPANILIDKTGQVKVTDFGLAASVQSPADKERQVSGTPAYMSPEQFAVPQTEHDSRTDLWALGVVLFECLTRKRPFPGSTLSELKQQIVLDPLPTLSDSPHPLPAPLRDLVARCLERDPNLRPDSAATIARALRTIAAELAAERPAAPLEPRTTTRRSTMAAVGVAVAALLMVPFLAWLNPRSTDRIAGENSDRGAVFGRGREDVRQPFVPIPLGLEIPKGRSLSLLTIRPEALMFPSNDDLSHYDFTDSQGRFVIDTRFRSLFSWAAPQPESFRWTTDWTFGDRHIGSGLCWNLHRGKFEGMSGYYADVVRWQPDAKRRRWDVSLSRVFYVGAYPSGVHNKSWDERQLRRIDFDATSSNVVQLTVRGGVLRDLTVFGVPVDFQHEFQDADELHRCRLGLLVDGGNVVVLDSYLKESGP